MSIPPSTWTIGIASRRRHAGGRRHHVMSSSPVPRRIALPTTPDDAFSSRHIYLAFVALVPPAVPAERSTTPPVWLPPFFSPPELSFPLDPLRNEKLELLGCNMRTSSPRRYATCIEHRGMARPRPGPRWTGEGGPEPAQNCTAAQRQARMRRHTRVRVATVTTRTLPPPLAWP